jgi:hypothetical protein
MNKEVLSVIRRAIKESLFELGGGNSADLAEGGGLTMIE